MGYWLWAKENVCSVYLVCLVCSAYSVRMFLDYLNEGPIKFSDVVHLILENLVQKLHIEIIIKMDDTISKLDH